uniref:Integrase catalytic domain-containing protein n=1 Tax=Bracon brevicornis TaxID=1563983 RepID=A0A6V7JIS5_9HYME
MSRDMLTFVNQCDRCQKTKADQIKPAVMMDPRRLAGPWATASADIVGPLTRSSAGFCYILVMQDLYTKWVEVCRLRQATGKKIRECIENVIFNR